MGVPGGGDGRRGAPLGLPGQGGKVGRRTVQKGKKTTKVEAILWAHCCSEWGVENWGPLFLKVL